MKTIKRHKGNRYILDTSVYSLVAFALVCLILFLHFYYPVSFSRLIMEDEIGEYGTFGCYGLTAVLMLILSFRHGICSQKIIWVLIGLATLVIAGEEVSWGQRILGLTTPDVLVEINVQNEITLHNILSGGMLYKITYAINVYFVFLWIIFSVIVSIKIPTLKERILTIGIPLIPVKLAPMFLISSSFFQFHSVAKSDEIGELFLAIAVAAWAVELFFSHINSKNRNLIRLGIFLLVASFSIGMGQIHWAYSSGKGISWRLNLMAARDYPKLKMYDQAENIFEYIYDHPQYITDYTHFNHGLMLIKSEKEDKAFIVLQKALDFLETEIGDNVQSSKDKRFRGKIFLLMGQSEDANTLFEQAIEIDRRQLETVLDPNEKAKLTWSIARTLSYSGDKEGAIKQANKAKGMNISRELRLNIENWINKLTNNASLSLEIY